MVSVAIYTSVQPIHQGARIWPSDDFQQAGGSEVLGPSRVAVTVRQPTDHSPYDLDLVAHLIDGTYVVPDITVMGLYERPDYIARAVQAFSGAGPDEPPELPTDSGTLPPVTSRGLSEIRLAAILQEALRGQCTVRRTMADGTVVTGVGREDELEVVYVLARAVGENPTQAVAEHFKIGRSAAAQRVARARSAGKLPPASQGAR
jgi:hypothetical protein